MYRAIQVISGFVLCQKCELPGKDAHSDITGHVSAIGGRQ